MSRDTKRRKIDCSLRTSNRRKLVWFLSKNNDGETGCFKNWSIGTWKKLFELGRRYKSIYFLIDVLISLAFILVLRLEKRFVGSLYNQIYNFIDCGYLQNSLKLVTNYCDKLFDLYSYLYSSRFLNFQQFINFLKRKNFNSITFFLFTIIQQFIKILPTKLIDFRWERYH